MKKLFKKAVASILAAAIVLPVGTAAVFAETSDKAAEPNYYFGSFYYRPGEGELYGLSDSIDYFAYSDDYFKKSGKIYDAHLSTLSMSLAEASVSSTREPFTPEGYANKNRDVIAFLEDNGFSDIAINDDYKTKPTKNTIGVACAHKKIVDNGKEYTMLTIVPRSAGYEYEWGDNFVLGAEGDAKGFDNSSNKCLDFARGYVEETGISGDIKVWTVGYSRGAAITNLTAKKLIDNPQAALGESINLDPENLYAYTFGTPLAADSTQNPRDEKYSGIFNIYQTSELASSMAPAEMGFERYGSDTMIKDMDKYDAMLANLKICNPDIYEEFITTTSSEHFIPKKLGIKDGSFGLVDDTNSYIPNDASVYLAGLGAYLTQITGGRAGYAENYEQAFSDFIGYYRSLNGDDGSAFGSGFIGSDDTLDMAVAMYAYFMKQKFKEEINATKEEILAKAEEIAMIIRSANASESKDGTEPVGIDAKQVADLALKLGKYLLMDADEIRPIAAVYLGNVLENAMAASSATDEQIAGLVNTEALNSLTHTLSHLLFGNIWQSRQIRPLLINNEQMKNAATLADNITKLMYDHTNEVYISWLRLDDSYFADYHTLTDAQIQGYRRVYVDADNLENVNGVIIDENGKTAGTIKNGVLTETTDKWVGFTTTDDGGFFRIPNYSGYTLKLDDFNGSLSVKIGEYDTASTNTDTVFEQTVDVDENTNVNIVIPQPGDGEYKISVADPEPKPGELKSGDINGDGVIDILDAVMVQKCSVDKVALTEDQQKAADVNGDGIVDILDAVLIQKYTVDKVTELPVK